LLQHLPNLLTLLRIVLAPVVAGMLFWGTIETFTQRLSGDQRLYSVWMFATAGVFLFAALTDLLDGVAARLLNAESKFGRLMDPIADKVLVGLPLIVYALLGFLVMGVGPLAMLVLACVVAIVGRDILMTVVRLRAPDREGPRVSSLAKVKTALEMAAVGYWPVLYTLDAGLQTSGLRQGEWISPIWIGVCWLALLLVAAALSVWTAWRYLRPPRDPNT
jgi:cardiolipin synthase (CMP-forming)